VRARVPLAPNLLLQPVHFLALGFGSGLSPRAPGTLGSFVALPLAWLMLSLPLGWRAIVVIVAVALGVYLCGESARRIGVHDHPGIVWDEMTAVMLLTLLLPTGWLWLLAAVFVFRVFDIVKPWPIRDLDHRLRGGLGIMLDDLVAAVFAAVVLRLIEYLVTLI
jgi:phosphatidylglycerophosphatase A